MFKKSPRSHRTTVQLQPLLLLLRGSQLRIPTWLLQVPLQTATAPRTTTAACSSGTARDSEFCRLLLMKRLTYPYVNLFITFMFQRHYVINKSKECLITTERSFSKDNFQAGRSWASCSGKIKLFKRSSLNAWVHCKKKTINLPPSNPAHQSLTFPLSSHPLITHNRRRHCCLPSLLQHGRRRRRVRMRDLSKI